MTRSSRRRRADRAIRAIIGLVTFAGFACSLRRHDTIWTRLLLVGMLTLTTACLLFLNREAGAIGSVALLSIALFRPSELRFRGGDLEKPASSESRVSYDLISELMDP